MKTKILDNQKTITVDEAAHFVGIEARRFHNLVKRGDFDDVAQAIPSDTNRNVSVLIKSGAFLAKYALTWDDIFAVRKMLREG